jgi:hypothetical protein
MKKIDSPKIAQLKGVAKIGILHLEKNIGIISSSANAISNNKPTVLGTK